MEFVGGVVRSSARRPVLIALALVAAVAGVWLFAGTGVRAAVPPAPLPATMTLTGGGRFVPRSFFGLSVEYDQLAQYEDEGTVFDRAISLVRPQDGSLMLLRLGGKSADHVYWQTRPAKAPHMVIRLDPDWMTRLANLVTRERLRVMLDLNLAVHSPTMVASFARAARAALPRGRVVGLEVGNEPDLYWRQPWLANGRIPSTMRSTPLHWTVNYSPGNYRHDWSAYARTLTPALRGIPLGGPELISNKPPWLNSIGGLGRYDPGFITIHRYASSNCWPRTSPWWPTIRLMLNEGSSAGLGASVESAATYAHSRREALRLTEVNSISCGGNMGVANAFVTALWAPDALFSMILNGVDSVSWHIRPKQLNAPWELTPNGIQPMPELYGLAMFAQLIRPGAELLNSSLVSALHVKAWAVRTPQGLRVLVINKGARAASITLRLGTGSRSGFLRRLLAPRVSSRTGITWGGQTIGSDARWHGKVQTTTVGASGGVYRFGMSGYSAAVLSVWR